MPYARPTLTELKQQALQDVQNGGIPGVTRLLRFSVLYVLAMVLAGLSHLHYGFLDWISKQAVPWTATGEYLEAWGALKGVVRKAATSGSGALSFSVSSDGIIPSGTEFQASGNIALIATADSVTSGGTTTIQCAAVATGAATNLAAGTSVVLSSPVAGVQTSGIVTTAFSGGSDQETDSELRTRVLTAFEEGGENGSSADYIRWATAVSGVTRAWVNPLGAGAGSVVVYIMLDSVRASQGGFPQGADGGATQEKRYLPATGDQLVVANAIYGQRPVTALVVVVSPVAQPIDFDVGDLGDNNTTANQSAIKAALADMFVRLSEPGGTIYPNAWSEALGALGLSQFGVVSPSSAIVATGVGYMPTLGNVTFGS
ncbi:baseplate J/gp47 family protein [Gluconobacter cerinus]|uniref:Baseplate protein J-like domain-containing protein n=1 Tax=Gluconobacter cerinus TaxID=38307 RepID=A0AAV5NAJ6_9PROT|nr:baseplate J/gp47 family protein [Gluconobacter cerinus]GBR03111.1 bacteriophage protein [Gluconobacter cerinus NRIC 0229]GLQ61542.1 hypothetical protein GCM10007867_03870 [Gluconobacter cerinus]